VAASPGPQPGGSAVPARDIFRRESFRPVRREQFEEETVMVKLAASLVLTLGLVLAAAPAAAQASIGFGVHSWRTIDDLRSEGFGDVKRSGFSYLVSYQAKLLPFVRAEIDGEFFPKGFGGSTHTAIAPEAFILVGAFIYGGVGVGTIYSSTFNHDFSNPFYIGRAGVDLHLLPRFTLDLNGNYEVAAFNQLRHVKTGTVTLGAVARLKL
jgi:hypothetical protein